MNFTVSKRVSQRLELPAKQAAQGTVSKHTSRVNMTLGA